MIQEEKAFCYPGVIGWICITLILGFEVAVGTAKTRQIQYRSNCFAMPERRAAVSRAELVLLLLLKPHDLCCRFLSGHMLSLSLSLFIQNPSLSALTDALFRRSPLNHIRHTTCPPFTQAPRRQNSVFNISIHFSLSFRSFVSS